MDGDKNTRRRKPPRMRGMAWECADRRTSREPFRWRLKVSPVWKGGGQPRFKCLYTEPRSAGWMTSPIRMTPHARHALCVHAHRKFPNFSEPPPTIPFVKSKSNHWGSCAPLPFLAAKHPLSCNVSYVPAGQTTLKPSAQPKSARANRHAVQCLACIACEKCKRLAVRRMCCKNPAFGFAPLDIFKKS